MSPEVKDCLDTIMSQPSKGLMAYAQTCALAALEGDMSGHTLSVQLLYVLKNLSGWRGVEARVTKGRLMQVLSRRNLLRSWRR